MRGFSLSGTKAYALSNYSYFFLQTVLNFFLTPILLSGLGPVFFGIWRTILRFLDFATVVDGRPTQALKWTIARRSQDGDTDVRQRAVGSAIAVWVIWTPVLVALLILLVWVSPHIMRDLTPEQVQVARLVTAVLALNVVFGGVLGIPDAVLIGAGQGYRSINLNALFLLINSIALAIAALAGADLVILAAITVVTTTFNALMTWRVARHHIQWWGVRKPDRQDISTFSSLSGWNLLWAIVNQLMLSTELVLFARLVGAEGVTQYSVTAYASQAGQMICMFTISALIPRLASLLGVGQLRDAGIMVRQAREIALALAMWTSCAILLFNGSFVSLWVGAEHYLGPNLNAWIVLAFLQLAIIRCDGQIIDATMDIRGRAIYGLVASTLAIGGALLAFHLTRSIEACLAVSIGARFIQSVSYALSIRRQVPEAGYPWKQLLVALALMGLCFVAGGNIRLGNWAELILAAGLSSAVIGAIVFFAMLSKDTLARMGLNNRGIC